MMPPSVQVGGVSATGNFFSRHQKELRKPPSYVCWFLNPMNLLNDGNLHSHDIYNLSNPMNNYKFDELELYQLYLH